MIMKLEGRVAIITGTRPNIGGGIAVLGHAPVRRL